MFIFFKNGFSDVFFLRKFCNMLLLFIVVYGDKIVFLYLRSSVGLYTFGFFVLNLLNKFVVNVLFYKYL